MVFRGKNSWVMIGVDDEFSQSGRITKEKDELQVHFELRRRDRITHGPFFGWMV
jgi:hypothetical protein